MFSSGCIKGIAGGAGRHGGGAVVRTGPPGAGELPSLYGGVPPNTGQRLWRGVRSLTALFRVPAAIATGPG